MKITCQSCQSKYTVSDEKVQGKTVKIKCRKCGATILVNSGGVTTNGAGPADPVSITGGVSVGDGASFLVNVADGDQRSMSLAEIVTAYNGAVISPETYVWSDGMGDWKPLGEVEMIVAALNAPAVEAPRLAARRDPGRAAPDLFGGGQTEEVVNRAPAYNGAAPPARPSTSATGNRDENSMLFSLSALTAKAATPSSSSTKKETKEDSGVIDLRALAASAGASAPSHSLPVDAGLFPLGAPPPAAAPAVAMSSMPVATPSKAPIFIGIGIAVAAFAIVGAFFAMKGGGEKQAPVADSSAQITAAPTPSATASAAPVESAAAPAAASSASAAPSSSAMAASSASAPTNKGSRGSSRGIGGPSKGTSTTATTTQVQSTPTAAPPPVKKSGGCGCAAGDLMCAMRCSAGSH